MVEMDGLVDGYGWMWVWVDGNVSKLDIFNILLFVYFSCAKDANHSQILGSLDPLFYFYLFH